MNRKELRAAARTDLDDEAKPYLWSDAFLDSAANEAEVEASRRGRLLVDSTDPQICSIPLVLNNALYDLDPRVIFVRRVKSSACTKPLDKIRLRDLDAILPGWEAHTGSVLRYCSDYQTGKLLTYRKPIVSSDLATLSLTVVRQPLRPMAKDGDSPEIAPRFHPSLRHWMVFLAYMKPDEDTYRPDKAKVALALFEQEFGKKSSAIDEQWIDDNHGYDGDEGLF